MTMTTIEFDKQSTGPSFVRIFTIVAAYGPRIVTLRFPALDVETSKGLALSFDVFCLLLGPQSNQARNRPSFSTQELFQFLEVLGRGMHVQFSIFSSLLAHRT